MASSDGPIAIYEVGAASYGDVEAYRLNRSGSSQNALKLQMMRTVGEQSQGKLSLGKHAN